MDRTFISRWSSSAQKLAALLVLLALCVGAAPYASAATQATDDDSGETVYAITTDNELLRFKSDNPRRINAEREISGLQRGEKLLGIDFRPATGQLYGLGSTSRLYVIDPRNGKATPVGAQPFTPALDGKAFGFDFNPTVDRIRVVSDRGQNLRLHPDTGAVAGVDTALAYAAGDRNAGRKPQAVGAGYTNNVAGATSTSLYVIDMQRDVLTLQGSAGGSPISPNTGQLTTVGKLGVDAEDLVGFDVSPSGRAYAAMVADGDGVSGASFATIDLESGRASRFQRIGDGERVRGLAVEIKAPKS
jgi:hypothetical protein